MPASKYDAGVDDVCVPEHVHFASYHLVPTVVHVVNDTVVVVV